MVNTPSVHVRSNIMLNISITGFLEPGDLESNGRLTLLQKEFIGGKRYNIFPRIAKRHHEKRKPVKTFK